MKWKLPLAEDFQDIGAFRQHRKYGIARQLESIQGRMMDIVMEILDDETDAELALEMFSELMAKFPERVALQRFHKEYPDLDRKRIQRLLNLWIAYDDVANSVNHQW